jgi:anti-sigma B factor antagonist
MTTSLEREGETVVLRVSGSINSQTAPDFQRALDEAMEEGAKVTVDFKATDYVSSAGLRVLLTAENKLEGKGELTLINVSKEIKDVFDMTGFSDILTII